MARITEEQIEEINEVYYRTKNKSQTAREVGVSVSSVSKYIREGYVPRAQRQVYTFNEKPSGARALIEKMLASENPIGVFCAGYELSDEEKADLVELQKEV